jgi:hypothetical protein
MSTISLAWVEPEESKRVRRGLNSPLKKGFRALFQLGSSRHWSATACADQAPDVLDLRASHPWLALTVPLKISTAC